jgi:hypothetical protein
LKLLGIVQTVARAAIRPKLVNFFCRISMSRHIQS